eukprot:scaffold3127_cov202-Prasinococcus_capsulatus_cf.AAC.13
MKVLPQPCLPTLPPSRCVASSTLPLRLLSRSFQGKDISHNPQQVEPATPCAPRRLMRVYLGDHHLGNSLGS